MEIQTQDIYKRAAIVVQNKSQFNPMSLTMTVSRQTLLKKDNRASIDDISP